MAIQIGKPLISHDQNFIHLTSIQSVSLGLPVIFIGRFLTTQYSAGTAICSILIGNFILWLIAISIISMAFEERKNAIENVKTYLGKYGAMLMWVILIVSFLNWFVLQINFTLPTLRTYFNIDLSSNLVRLGAGIGFLTALLAIGGIRLIKWITLVSLPPIFCYYLYATVKSDYSFSSLGGWGLSIPAIITAILTLLPGVINYPTFFRHSKNKADSYLAITLMTVLISFFEIATIWMQFTKEPGSEFSFFAISTLVFLLWSLICTNLVNIYFASACWESIFPQFEGAKGYAIIGLIGTAAYTFIQIYTPILFLENLANCYLASLGIVLLIAFLVRLMVRHRPRPFEKGVNSFCWLVGCITATILTVQDTQNNNQTILYGMGACVVTFLVILFIEENAWAIQNLWKQKNLAGE